MIDKKNSFGVMADVRVSTRDLLKTGPDRHVLIVLKATTMNMEGEAQEIRLDMSIDRATELATRIIKELVRIEL